MSGIITGTRFKKYFAGPGETEPTAIELGTMVAVLEVGAFSMFVYFLYRKTIYITVVTSVAAGRIGDLIGRRGTLFLGALIFTLGGAIQTFTTGFNVMVVGRIISGFGVGLLSYVVLIFRHTDDELNGLAEPLYPSIRAKFLHRTTYVFFMESLII